MHNMKFPSVPEGVLRQVYKDLSLSEPAVGEATSDYKEDLALGLMAHLEPNMNQQEAMVALRKCQLKENRHAEAKLQVNEEMLRDVVLQGEHSHILGFMKELQIASAKQACMADSSREKVARLFRPASAGRPKARPKAKAKVVAAPKWVPAAGSNTLQSAKLWLDKHKPPSSHIVCDDKNGRWLCSLLPFGRKSFSWTKRGQEKAVAAVFFQLWSWHKDLGGEEPPWSLDSLQAPP